MADIENPHGIFTTKDGRTRLNSYCTLEIGELKSWTLFPTCTLTILLSYTAKKWRKFLGEPVIQKQGLSLGRTAPHKTENLTSNFNSNNSIANSETAKHNQNRPR